MPESSRLAFFKKLFANSFALSEAEGNISGSLSRGGIADLLLLRTLIVIHKNLWDPSFGKYITLFVLLA